MDFPLLILFFYTFFLFFFLKSGESTGEEKCPKDRVVFITLGGLSPRFLLVPEVAAKEEEGGDRTLTIELRICE